MGSDAFDLAADSASIGTDSVEFNVDSVNIAAVSVDFRTDSVIEANLTDVSANFGFIGADSDVSDSGGDWWGSRSEGGVNTGIRNGG